MPRDMGTRLGGYRFLIVCLLFFGCTTTSSTDSTHPTHPSPYPSGISEATLQHYPPSDYLYGVGLADSEQAAVELARADLTKKIQVRVTTAASDIERSQGEQSEQALGRLVTTRSNELMKGTTVAELHRDSRSGYIQAVVVMSKDKTERLSVNERTERGGTTASGHSSEQMVPVWVTAVGQVPFGPDTTVAEAAARSRDLARRQAVERALGTLVTGETIVYNTTVTEDRVHSTVRGMIIEEDILEEGVQSLDRQTGSVGLMYATKLRAKVKPVQSDPHHELRLEVELNRTVFHEGEDVQVVIVPSKNAYIYILNVGQDDLVTMVFPNKFAHDNYLSAQREFLFPDDRQRKMGIRLKTALPPGEGKAIEKVKVLATSKQLPHAPDRHRTGSFSEKADGTPFFVKDLMK